MYSRIFFTRSVVLLSSWIGLFTMSTQAEDRATSEKEGVLIAILRSDASPAEKAITCKKLAIEGSSESVPELAKLLSDQKLSSWARIALEAIPGDAADEALRRAAGSLEGNLLVGVINSIGVRRDAKAVESLINHMQDKNTEVASAAAVALGRIGNDAATKTLRQSLSAAPAKVRSAIAEGCVLCAERLHASGNSKVATEIYDEIRAADVPKQRVVEATRGAILARGQAGIPLLMETFRSPDKKMFQLALGTVREFPGNQVDQALVKELASATPQRASLIIQAMADRPETVVLAAVLEAASKGDKQVRLSAIDALQRVGNQSCLSDLLKIANEKDQELASGAKKTLAVLPGKNVNNQIITKLPDATGESYVLLLQLVGERRIDAVDEVVKALDNSDKDVRHAALFALGETVKLENLPVLITQVLSPKNPEDATQAQQALKTASIRMPDQELCTRALVKAMQRSPSAKSIMLEIVAAVGGSEALKTLADAAKSSNSEHQDISSRLLGKWNSVDAAPVLLDLAKTAPAEKFKIRALRGYVGIVRKFPMPNQQRVEMCQKALDASSRTAEQQLVLDVLKLYPSKRGLELANKARQIPKLKDDATAAAQFITGKLRK